jgi:formate hydrogenlyase subunit 3/multisubunit Na+/H+ antiporter MnhD subunit
MNLIHMICTVGGVLIIVGMIFLIQESQTDTTTGGAFTDDLNSGISILLLIVGVAQGVFLINWMGGWKRSTP